MSQSSSSWVSCLLAEIIYITAQRREASGSLGSKLEAVDIKNRYIVTDSITVPGFCVSRAKLPVRRYLPSSASLFSPFYPPTATSHQHVFSLKERIYSEYRNTPPAYP